MYHKKINKPLLADNTQFLLQSHSIFVIIILKVM
jgi:hypothetical protein